MGGAPSGAGANPLSLERAKVAPRRERDNPTASQPTTRPTDDCSRVFSPPSSTPSHLGLPRRMNPPRQLTSGVSRLSRANPPLRLAVFDSCGGPMVLARLNADGILLCRCGNSSLSIVGRQWCWRPPCPICRVGRLRRGDSRQGLARLSRAKPAAP